MMTCMSKPVEIINILMPRKWLFRVFNRTLLLSDFTNIDAIATLEMAILLP